MPDEDHVIVVGDRFAEFLTNRGAITLAELTRRVDAGARVRVTVGQGLSAAQLDEVRAFAERGAVVVGRQGVPAPVEQRLTHKHDPKNVQVGPARAVRDHEYELPLVLDQRTEVLEDHLTGQHVPAITLLEAARQAWTVVTEQYLLAEQEPQRFVIEAVNSRFDRFVFPLPATVRCRVESRQSTPGGHLFDMRVTFEQGGFEAATVEVSYRVVPERYSQKHESLAARQAVRAHLTAPDSAPVHADVADRRAA